MARILSFSRYRRHPKRPGRRKWPRISFWRIRRASRRYGGAVALLLVVGAIVFYDRGSQPAAPLVSGSPISVYDGDTIRLGSERIRIVGLDTPEYGNKARCRAEALAAEQAKQELQRLLAAGNVVLYRQGTDRYDRTLARVTVDGRDVAPALIAMGLARPYDGGRRAGWCN